jgi:hypothetical protein
MGVKLGCTHPFVVHNETHDVLTCSNCDVQFFSSAQIADAQLREELERQQQINAELTGEVLAFREDALARAEGRTDAPTLPPKAYRAGQWMG